ncbi:motility protein A, partial [Azospirillum sp. A39]
MSIARDTVDNRGNATAPVAPGGVRPRGGLDAATLLGLAAAVGVIVAAVVLGGAPGAFVDTPSLLIVLGGTLAVTTAGFSLAD